jgi:hypothetical protein
MKTKATHYLLYLFCSLFSIGLFAQNITTTASTSESACDGFATFDHPTEITSWDWFDSNGSLIQPGGDYLGQLCQGNYFLTFFSEITATSETLSFTIDYVAGVPCDNFFVTLEPVFSSDATVCDGSIYANVTGGQEPLLFSWSNGETTQEISNLCEGDYSVYVSDNGSCSSTQTIYLSSGSTDPNDTIPAGSDCSGFDAYLEAVPSSSATTCDGSLNVIVNGGISPYLFSWSNGMSSEDHFSGDLCPGDYSVEVLDANGCMLQLYGFVDSEIGTDPNDTIPSGSDCSSFVGYIEELSTSSETACDGSLNVIINGGISPYTFNWSTGISTTDHFQEGLCAGYYYVDVTDAVGCVIQLTGLVGVDNDSTSSDCAGFYAYTNSTAVSQDGVCDGAIDVVVMGGLSPYEFHWADGLITSDSFMTGLCQGPNNVDVKDANGCLVHAEGYVDFQSDSVPGGTSCDGFYADLNIYSVSSVGSCDGGISVEPVGGLAPYEFHWLNNATNSASYQDGLCEGPVEVEVIDANGCPYFISAYVGYDGDSIPDGSTPCDNLHAYSIPTPVSASGNCDGSAEIMAEGGVAPFEYLINGTVYLDGQLITGLCEGTYDVMVKDVEGCETYTYIYIGTQADSSNGPCADLNAYTIPYPASSATVCDGALEIIVTGGTAPFEFISSQGDVSTDPYIENLCQGAHDIQIVDATGCTFYTMGYVGGDFDSIPDSNCDGFYAFINTNSTSGQGLCDGSADIVVEGGVAPYQFNWLNGVITTDPFSDGLCEGHVYVEVKDELGCTVFVEGYVGGTFDSIPSGNCADFYAYTIPGSTSGPGLCDGSMEVVVMGGLAPYEYHWSTGDMTYDPIINGLCEGAMDVEVKDSVGCLYHTYGFVSSPQDSVPDSPCAEFSAYAIPSPTSSATSCDGSLEIAVTGGVGPYMIIFTDGTVSNDLFLQGLCEGSYDLVVQDSLGCNFHTYGYVPAPFDSIPDTNCDGFYAYTMTTPVSASGICDGSIDVVVNGGVGPYEFIWTDGSATTDAFNSGLCEGPNDVIVYDSQGCSFTTTGFIDVNDEEPPVSCAGFYAYTIASSISADGSCDGSLDIVVVGGVSPYQFMLPDSSITTDNFLSDLCEGSYSIGVKDDVGCTFFTYGYVGAAVDTASNPDCAGLYAYAIPTPSSSDPSFCDGSIEVVVNGGEAPYEYQWSNGVITSEGYIDGLCEGLYDVQVIDALGCLHHTYGFVGVASDSVETDPCQGFEAGLNTQPVTMPSECDGYITIDLIGGVGPFEIVWSNGVVGEMGLQNLCMGGYGVNITDANGCNLFLDTYIDEDTIFDDPCANVVLTTTNYSQDATSNTSCNGKITAFVSGGQGPYQFIWEGSSSTIYIANNLCPGTYEYTAKDIHGCEVSSYGTVGILPAPPAPQLVGYAIPMGVSDGDTCDGHASVVVQGGVPPYNYLYSSGETTPTASALCSGLQGVIVSDQDGNALYLNFIIAAPEQTITNDNFADSTALDSLFNEPVSDCSIDYENVDSAFVSEIDIISGDSVSVTWTVIYGDTAVFFTDVYFFSDGSGIYQITLQLYCPDKAIRDYLSATDKIHYSNGSSGENGLGSLNLSSVNVYPNPFHNQITIVIGNSNESTIIVNDLSGHEMFVGTYHEAEISLDLNHLAYGNYLITVINNSNVSTHIMTKY